MAASAMAVEKKDAEMRVYVRNMVLDTDTFKIRRELVDVLGLPDPVDIYIVRKGNKMTSAFFSYQTEEECELVVASLSGTLFLSKIPVDVMVADPPPPQSTHGRKLALKTSTSSLKVIPPRPGRPKAKLDSRYLKEGSFSAGGGDAEGCLDDFLHKMFTSF